MGGCFDNITGHFRAGELAVIAARPAMGKTTFALGLARHMAVKNGVPTVFFSLELSKEQAAARILLPSGESHETLLFIDDTTSASVYYIREKLELLSDQNGVKLVIVDYLQLLRGNRDNRRSEMRCISRELKTMAEDLKMPIVVLSQLSRKPETRLDHRPITADFGESSVIVKYADLVAFLYREEYYATDDQKTGETEFIIVKGRSVEIGTITLKLEG